MNVDMPIGASLIINALNNAGYKAYIVGGCVRDILLDKTPNDWDICTSATPEHMQTVFRDYKTVSTGLKHGTITVFIDNTGYEVTTFRIDGEYSDHRRPDNVTYTDDLIIDLSRRDFTFNAMAYSPIDGLIDPFRGKSAIENKTISCVGDPEARFGEDPLRIIRALRFSSIAGFNIDHDTSTAIHNLKHLLNSVSRERISSELKKLLVGLNVGQVLLQYVDVLCEIIPEIEPCVGFDQHNRYHDSDVWCHTVKAISKSKPDFTIRMALLLHDLGKPSCFVLDDNGNGHFYGHAEASEIIARNVLGDLKFDNETINTVSMLVGLHNDEISVSHRSVRKILNKIGVDNSKLLLEIRRADNRAHAEPYNHSDITYRLGEIIDDIISQEQCFKLKDLRINGYDVINLGAEQGKCVGSILKEILEKVINGDIQNNHEELIAYANHLLHISNKV